METKIAINNLTNSNVLTILEGKALELKQPEKIILKGNIKAVSAFIKKRYRGRIGKGLQSVDQEKAVVIVQDDRMGMVLMLDPENVFGLEVHANLESTPELTQFGINNEQQFTREALVKMIRFNRRFFKAGTQQALLEAYMKLQLTGNTELSVSSDNRGNKEAVFKKFINSQNIPQEFILEIPIFRGFEPETFRVEICIEATDASVRFWFESVELTELIEKRKTEILDAELEYCQDFVIIEN